MLSREEIAILIDDHSKDPGARILQKKLAECITIFVHGQAEFVVARQTTEQLFGKGEELNLREMDETQLLSAMDGVPEHKIGNEQLNVGMDVVSFLFESGIFPSKGEARKMVQGGGISINKEKVTTLDLAISNTTLLCDRYIVVQKGKKNHFLVKTTV